ncbi:cytochrome C551 [Salipaludibacillus keqinensis]|uniref:Cytochrome C551 n=1 Tax=Salipaludibacillus keqinensis TaxID=2045207 RepID=A0A323TJ91_9BACI|nr:cytochrome c [Salipaludibacillus keqinensis]PYZ94266.1 cytochrome C551 [Salipaludibacillus keqinensis]
MRGKPLYPFALTAILGIGLIIVLSFVGINIGPDSASENGEENGEEQEFDDPIELGEHIYEGQCASCHGGDLDGGSGPALDGGNYSEEDILTAISEGPGNMPAGLVSGEEAEAVAEFILAENE